MKIAFRTVLFALFLVLCSCVSQEARLTQKFLSELPEPVQYEPPKVNEWKLDNGLTVFFVEDHELPLVQGTLYVKGGSYWDALESRGSISAMGNQLREGGTLDLAPNELDRRLEELSASIGSSFGGEFGTVSFQSLSADFGEVFSIFRDVVRDPAFDQTRLDLWKAGSLESIRRRGDDPETIASIASSQLLYGEGPYGTPLDSRSVRKIDRLALLRAHRRLVRPDEAYLALSGNLSIQEAKEAVADAFGDWEKRGEPLPSPPPAKRNAPAGVYFIEGDFPQANVKAVHLGPKRHSEDEYAIRLFNDIFGSGGFDSRLMQELRVRRGLVYGVWGVISPLLVSGENLIFLQTKGETAAEAFEAAVGELREMQEQPPEEERLKVMKTASQASFVFKFASSEQLATRQALLEILDYPEDYDERFLERLLAVSPEEVQMVARDRWRAEDFIVTVVGDASAYQSLQEKRKVGSSLLSALPLFRAEFGDKLGSVERIEG